MRLSCLICATNLITLGIFGGVYAFFGFNLLQFLCLNNLTAMRITLAVDFVSALFLIYALIVFKPFKGLK
ncbi:MAG: hypothetical protein ACI4L9_01220 [Candidatus Coproplasma sp.]